MAPGTNSISQQRSKTPGNLQSSFRCRFPKRRKSRYASHKDEICLHPQPSTEDSFNTIGRLLSALILLAVLVAPAFAQSELGDLIYALASGKLKQRGAQIEAIAATGDIRAVLALQALREGKLYFRKSDDRVFITQKDGKEFRLIDPLTGETVETFGKKTIRKVKVNNKLRRQIGEAVGSLTLLSDVPQTRIATAEALFKSGDPAGLDLLQAALAEENDHAVKAAMERARAAVVLKSDAPDDDKVAAIDLLRHDAGRQAMPLLREISAGADGAVAAAAEKAIAQIDSRWSSGTPARPFGTASRWDRFCCSRLSA